MLVIAHRGANKEALENSWDAFGKAIEGRADRIELDVQLTADGHAAVMHDDLLLHCVGISQRISLMTRDEIARLKLKNGEPIPFLDEVIRELLPKIELNIELKGNSRELAEVVGRLVMQSPYADKVVASAFEPDPLNVLRDRYPRIRRACLWSLDTLQWPFVASYAPPVFLQDCQTNILHPQMELVDENLMDQATARGWIVYAWAPMIGEDADREARWSHLKRLGVHGLCTNYPRQFKLWLEEAAGDEARYKPS